MGVGPEGYTSQVHKADVAQQGSQSAMPLAPQPGCALDASFTPDSPAVITVESKGKKVTLINSEYATLKAFAEANGASVEQLLSGIEVSGGRITSLGLPFIDVVNVAPLSALTGLTKLHMSCAKDLSLKGLPQTLESLTVFGFGGKDLTDFKDLNLKVLRVRVSPNVRSLEGAPETVEWLEVGECDVGPTLMPQGKLQDMSKLQNLKGLIVDRNRRLESLAGLPNKSLEIVSAASCGLHGDQTRHLQGASNLTRVSVGDNFENLVVDTAQLKPGVEVKTLYSRSMPKPELNAFMNSFPLVGTCGLVGTIFLINSSPICLGFYALAAAVVWSCKKATYFQLADSEV